MGASKIILIIEDDQAIQDLITDCLTDDGYTIRRGFGDAALASALADPPDMIVMDLWMPGYTGGFASAGEYIIDTVRHNRATATTPIIVLTARMDKVASALLLGANRALAKPFDIAELSQVIAEQIGPPVVKEIG